MTSAGNTRVHWYERIGPRTDASSRWLRAAALLPEAVPRRFGDSEPLLHRFDEEGPEGLRAAEQGADGLLFLRSSAPAREAALATPTTAKRLGPFGAHVLTTTLPPDDPSAPARVHHGVHRSEDRVRLDLGAARSRPGHGRRG